MNGKINEYGTLEIERHGKMVPQWCPFKNTACSDLCPLFGEPHSTNTLKICQGRVLEFEMLTDERE